MRDVLFVDDERRVLDGLRRGLRDRRHEWRMSFAVGGAEAIELLRAQRFDVVVSDMRMPGLDGAALLLWVRDHQPAAGRVILSGQSEQSAVLRASVAAHRFVHKPCELTVLGATVDSLLEGPALSDESQLLVVPGPVAALAGPPLVVARMRHLLDRPDRRLAAAVGAITAEIDRSARAVEETDEGAVPALAVTVLRGLLDAAQRQWPFHEGTGTQRHRVQVLSARAVAAASLASSVARHRLDETQQQHAGMAALLQDVGRLSSVIGEDDVLETDLRDADRLHVPVHQLERQRHGVSRTELGAGLLRLWGLPAGVVAAVARADEPYDGRPVGVREAARAGRLLLHGTALAEPGLPECRSEVRQLLREFGVEADAVREQALTDSINL